MLNLTWVDVLIALALLAAIGWIIRRAMARRPSRIRRPDNEDDWGSRLLEGRGKQRRHRNSTDSK